MLTAPPLEPRESRRSAVREFKRTLVRDAARRIFVAHGIDAASMREIAQAAGCSTGLIYSYFATKEDLYAEILRDGLQAQYLAVVGAASSATAGRGVTGLRALWRFYAEHPSDFDLGFYLYGGVRPAGLRRDLDHELNAQLDRVMTFIGECLVKDGLVAPARAHHRAVMHVTSPFGLMLMGRTGRLKSIDEDIGSMLESYLRVAARPDDDLRAKPKGKR